MITTIEEGKVIIHTQVEEVVIPFSEIYLEIPSFVFSFQPSNPGKPVPKWHILSISKTSCVLASSAGSVGNNFGTIYYKIIERK